MIVGVAYFLTSTRLLLHWWQQNTLGGGQMDKLVISALGVVLCVFPALAVRDVASTAEGTVKKSTLSLRPSW